MSTTTTTTTKTNTAPQVTQILGYNVKATFRTAKLYSQMTGGADYIEDLIDMEKMIAGGENEASGFRFRAVTVIDLFFALVASADPKLGTDEYYQEFMDSFQLSEVMEIIDDIITLVLGNVTDPKAPKVTKKATTTGKK